MRTLLCLLIAAACFSQADLDRARREGDQAGECRTICKVIRRRDSYTIRSDECFCMEREPRSRINAKAYGEPSRDWSREGMGDPIPPRVTSDSN
jgi:hypothetical protein